MLARAGVSVTLIARPAHADAIRRDGLYLDTVSFQERVTVEATDSPAGVEGADIILFCPKTLDTEEAAKSIAPYVAPGAIVVSLQNGVDNAERIEASSGIGALPAVVYIAVAMPGPGHIKHSGRGELVLGESQARGGIRSAEGRAERVAALFASAGVPCKVSENIETDLWTKFILNCAGNAVTAITQLSYGAAGSSVWGREIITHLIDETIALANALNVRLPEVNFVEMGLKFIQSIGDATSSTAQDLARRKPTEIYSLNGYVVRRGNELGIPVPINRTVHALVKMLEEKNARRENPALSAV
jgi:2-dehydropantoate 2-reductase